MAVPLASSAKVLSFWKFHRSCSAGIAFCDTSTCFMMPPKWFCVAGAILLHCFQKMSCIFRGKRSTLETSIVAGTTL